MKKTTLIIILLILFTPSLTFSRRNIKKQVHKENSLIKLARVKYSGGGDWYADPSAEVNLLNYVKANTNIPVEPIYEYVELASDNLFSYPILFLTGHGNMRLTDIEIKNLRAYLDNGGFLYVDDDYGLDDFIRRELKRVFPNEKFVEIPYTHKIFHSHFDFNNGVPKIHKHDGKAPQTFGMFRNGRLCIVYTYESNPSDGWADKEVHPNPEDKRELAMKFGVNLIVWALVN